MNFTALLARLAVALGALAACAGQATEAPARFNIREFGARGDGQTLDTAALQAALDACAQAGGGQVFLPPGRYLSGTVHLRSRVTLWFDAGARLIGTTNLAEYRQPAPPAFMPEARWGKWHRGLLVGEDLEDVALAGPGVIDGNKVFDPTGEERMRGPHTLVLVNCRRVLVRDLTFLDAANYAVFFMVCDDVEFRGATFIGGWDGVHWRGAPERWCRNVRVTDCAFYTGDDAIAGRYWDNTLIARCLINSSCNGIRLIGPATRLTIAQNLFRGPGEQPHRTSGERRRTNMLSGIILQPGAWDATRGLLDEVFVADNTMENVASPITLWTKPGNPVGRVTISGLNATGIYRAALSVESWAEAPITNVVVRGARLEFTGGGTAEQARLPVKGPGVDARPLPAWGVYARHVEHLVLEDVRLSLARDDLRPALLAEAVGRLVLDQVRYPAVAGVDTPLVLSNVTRVVSPDTRLRAPDRADPTRP
jgi:hypothetical protein